MRGEEILYALWVAVWAACSLSLTTAGLVVYDGSRRAAPGRVRRSKTQAGKQSQAGGDEAMGAPGARSPSCIAEGRPGLWAALLVRVERGGWGTD